MTDCLLNLYIFDQLMDLASGCVISIIVRTAILIHNIGRAAHVIEMIGDFPVISGLCNLYNLCISYSQDAFCINSLNLIAYNSQKSANRIRFSLMHELGHHLLRHRNDLPSNEDEANYFASNILAPRIAMYYAHLKSVNEVGHFFNLSSSAAYYAAQDFSEWCQDVRRNGMHSYDKDLYQHFYNPDYKGFVYSIRTCAFCGARVYNCLDFEAHCSGACKLPDEPVRKKAHVFTPLSDNDNRILRRLENKWLYDF